MFSVLILLLSSSIYPSLVLGSYDPGIVGQSEPIYESYGHNYGHTHKGSHEQKGGSVYHYHVPVVGQSHYPQQQSHSLFSSHNHHIWALLLLLGLALLLAKLLPLLLIPLGLSLLAVLLGGLMMMGMMMMMMMPGMMMMPNARTEHVGRAMDLVGQLGQVMVTGDVSGILAKYASSIDADNCPQKFICEIGSTLFSDNSTVTNTRSKRMSSYIINNLLPKGKAKRTFRQYEKAFFVGSTTQNCSSFSCQPKLVLNKSEDSKVPQNSLSEIHKSVLNKSDKIYQGSTEVYESKDKVSENLSGFLNVTTVK